jgi:hypothetical protein
VASPSPNKLVAVCEPLCSLSEEAVGPAISAVVIEMRERGAGAPTIHRRIAELGYKGHQNSVTRHLKHLRPAEEDPTTQVPAGQKVGDLEILDSIIAAGFRNSKNWKPSIKDTLDAMKLKAQMTGNSAFQDLIDLFDGAEVDEEDDEVAPEAVEALLSEDERPDESDEDLAEPLL